MGKTKNKDKEKWVGKVQSETHPTNKYKNSIEIGYIQQYIK